MATKNVYFYQIESASDFKKVLLAPENHQAIRIDKKDIEIKYVDTNPNGTITGIFVSTRKDGIAPAHKPGEEDFSAIQLKEDEGLAYPNAFLFDPQTNVILLEQNRSGATANNICEYFNAIDLKLRILLTADAYQRLNNMAVIQEVEIEVATPTQIIRNEYAQNATLRDFANISNDLHATKSIKLTIKSEAKQGGVYKPSLLQLINNILHIGRHTPGAKTSNKITVKGKQQDNAGQHALINDCIDLFENKLKGQFNLDEPPIQENIQAHDRKNAMLGIYKEKAEQIKSIIAIGN